MAPPAASRAEASSGTTRAPAARKAPRRGGEATASASGEGPLGWDGVTALNSLARLLHASVNVVPRGIGSRGARLGARRRLRNGQRTGRRGGHRRRLAARARLLLSLQRRPRRSAPLEDR